MAKKPTKRQVDRILEAFGGRAKLSDLTGISQTTIKRWEASGFVSAKRQDDILLTAQRKGIPLRPADFFNSAA